MSAEYDLVKVLQIHQVSPPPDSVRSTSLPLTFFDVSWIKCCPIQRVFLYRVPFSTGRFTEEILPQLKNSLSFALRRFFPLCGNLVIPPLPSEPYVLYNDGDSVPLLVAQSDGSLSEFLTDGPKDAMAVHQLVPPAPPLRVLDDTLLELMPLLAVQLTLFPNSGLCIGITFRHVVADGTSFNHFVKTWAAIFKASCDVSNVSISSPVHDREAVTDPYGIKYVLLDQWRRNGSQTWNKTTELMEDTVRATFTLSRFEIDQLKKWVAAKCGSTTLHLSSFVVTTAFIWVCYIKSLDMIATDKSDSKSDSSKIAEKLCHLGILSDCRNRYNMGIPATYFGNCLNVRYISTTRSKFHQEDSIAAISEALSHGVQSFKDGAVDEFIKRRSSRGDGEHVLTVAGSPRLAAFDTDFGWGRPAKTEVVHIDVSGSIALNDCGNEKGGIEVGICRSRHHMDVFSSFFRTELKSIL